MIAEHGWDKYFAVDLLDAEGPNLVVPIQNSAILDKNILGKDITKYSLMLTLSHFKGHPMSGYGRELKQLSIDCASSAGKAYIHTTDKKLSKKNCCKISLTKTTLLMQWQMLAKQLLTCSKATSPYVDLLKEIAYNIIIKRQVVIHYLRFDKQH